MIFFRETSLLQWMFVSLVLGRISIWPMTMEVVLFQMEIHHGWNAHFQDDILTVREDDGISILDWMFVSRFFLTTLCSKWISIMVGIVICRMIFLLWWRIWIRLSTLQFKMVMSKALKQFQSKWCPVYIYAGTKLWYETGTKQSFK